MKMPIGMMVYIIEKLIKDKKQFTVSSYSMDLRFRFTFTNDGMWRAETILGAVDCSDVLSYSYFHKLSVDIFTVHDLKGEEHEVIGFILYDPLDLEITQDIMIHDDNPDLNFNA